MLQIKLRIVLFILLIAVVAIIVRQVRNKRLDLRYTLSWLLLLAVLFVLVGFPQTLDMISSYLGVYSPVNMLFLMGFIFSLVIIFSLTAAVSKQADEIRKLAQELALLKRRREVRNDRDSLQR